MNAFTRIWISRLLVLLFIIPLFTKAIHDFGHRNDFHCTEKSAQHFHEVEHNCSLCDYQSPVLAGFISGPGEFVLLSSGFQQEAPVIVPHAHSPFFLLSSRGPPSLV